MDGCHILNHAFLDREAFFIQLTLKLSPDRSIFSCCKESFTEEPDCGSVRDYIRKSKELSK